MRNLTKALTVVSLLAPVSGYPLGIGDIRVRSALNQNLNAEISLVAGRGENPSNIKVSLAPAEKFDAAGIPWTYFLSKLRFQPVVKANGSMVIKVTSKEALKEPYLNFLLEVSWPKGNLYREFTVLVDPPADYQHESYQQPAYQEPVYPSESTYDTMPPVVERQEYMPRRRPVRAVRERSPRAPKQRRIAAGNYGGQIAVRRNDTMWNVAARARGAGVSVEQMMMALYNQNPQAFYQQNVNALSAGTSLKVPDKSTVEQLSRQDALAEFARHNEAWNTNRSGIPRTETQVAKEQTGTNQLELEPPTEAAVGANETVAPSSEQTSGSSKPAASPSPQQPATEQEEGAKGSAVVDQATQDKIAALEKQMAAMQQIIELKNKQLADLQNPANKQTQSAPAAPTPPVAQPQPQVEVKPVTPQQQPPAPPTTTQPPAAQTKPTQPAVPPTPTVKSPGTVAQPTPVPVAEGESFLPWILSAAGLTVLSLFGWLWWRKQKLLKETDAESMFRNYTMTRGAETGAGLTIPTRKTSAAAAPAVSGESSFLNEFKASDFESFESFNVDHSDIDPVAEADVYLAYGRYQQAEDLIKDAIKERPDRDDCKLKLLEIFQASSNTTEFEAYAKNLADSGKKGDANFWGKVILLARDISSDTELFSHSAQDNVAVFATDEDDTISESVLFDVTTPSALQFEDDIGDAAHTKVLPDTDDLGVATFEVDESEGEGSTFEVNEPVTPSASQGQGSENLADNVASRQDFSDQPLPSAADDGASIKGFQENDALDFDLGPYPQPKENKHSPIPDLVKPDDKAEIESYEFNFNFDRDKVNDQSAKPHESQGKDTWDAANTLEFSFDEGLSGANSLDDNETIDFNFELETPEVEAGKPLGNDFSVSDLTDMDEMETKLDLAKAYVDMGDAESAKDIIKQVIEHGSAEQKKTAQLLMDELSLG